MRNSGFLRESFKCINKCYPTLHGKVENEADSIEMKVALGGGLVDVLAGKRDIRVVAVELSLKKFS